MVKYFYFIRTNQQIEYSQRLLVKGIGRDTKKLLPIALPISESFRDSPCTILDNLRDDIACY